MDVTITKEVTEGGEGRGGEVKKGRGDGKGWGGGRRGEGSWEGMGRRGEGREGMLESKWKREEREGGGRELDRREREGMSGRPRRNRRREEKS